MSREWFGSKVLAGGAMIGLLCAALIQAPQASASVSYVVSMPAFTTANNNVSTTTTGGGKPVCRIYGQSASGGMSATNPIGWAVSDFTGNGPPAPLTQYQRGSSSYGGPACQVDGSNGQAAAGAMLNSGYATSQRYGFQLIQEIAAGSFPSPWTHGVFRLQVNWDLGKNDLRSAVQYSQICASFRDQTSGKTLRWCPSAWDSRGPQTEPSPFADPAGDGAYIVDTNFATGQKYSTLHCLSQTNTRSRATTGSYADWYAAYFSTQNLTAAVNVLNQTVNAGMSTNPANYFLTEILAGSEMSGQGATAGWMGSRVANFQVMDDAAPCT